MEKITKEELLAKLGGKALSDDELENVAGGSTFDECYDTLYNELLACINDPTVLNTQEHHEQCMQEYNMKLAGIVNDPNCKI